MFERFTDTAIKVIKLSQEEARCLGHNFVGDEGQSQVLQSNKWKFVPPAALAE